LKKKISDTKTPAEELTEAQRKLKNIEQEIIDQSDGYITAQDTKTNKLREQAGVQLELLNNMAALSEQEARAVVLDKQAQMPEFLQEYEGMEKEASELESSWLSAQDALSDYLALQAEHTKVMNSTSGAEQEKQLEALTARLKELTGDSGASFEYLPQIITTMRNHMNGLNEDLRTTQGELEVSKASYQEYYDANLRWIEAQYLGGDALDGMIAKYDTLSTEQKAAVDAAITELERFEQTLADIPVDKRVDINVAWRQTGTPPQMLASKEPEVTYKIPGFTGLPGYAEGGKITGPEVAWLGEGGDNEYVIPINNSPRSRGLYAAAGKELGIGQGGNFAPVFSPQIIIQGNADKQVIQQAMKDSQRDWERNLAVWQRQEARRNLV
jgi:hypothetical protein